METGSKGAMALTGQTTIPGKEALTGQEEAVTHVIMSHQTAVAAAVAFVMTGEVSRTGVRPIGVTVAALAATMSRMTDVGAASETDHVVIMVASVALEMRGRAGGAEKPQLLLLRHPARHSLGGPGGLMCQPSWSGPLANNAAA